MGKACELVGHRGAAAAPVPDSDRSAMRDEGRSDVEISAVSHHVDMLAQNFDSDPRLGPNRPGFDLMCRALGRDRFSQGDVNHGRQIVQRGRGAAYQIASLGSRSRRGHGSGRGPQACHHTCAGVAACSAAAGADFPGR